MEFRASDTSHHVGLVNAVPCPALVAVPDTRTALCFEQVYEDHLDFVWRSLRRLGIPQPHIEDAVQDVFLVIARRLSDFEGRSSLKTWVFGILLHTARNQRRRLRRRPDHDAVDADRAPDDLPGPLSLCPERSSEREQARRLLHRVLDCLDDAKREILMADLEGLTAKEMATIFSITPGNAYARVRSARQDFSAALRRLQAQDEGALRTRGGR